jgi:hypothetical protein
MKLHVVGFALLSAVAIFATAPAFAQNGTLTRSFVSSTGVDTNPCTVTQPCASFAHAYTMVGANGIVAALDPGKYGALTITGPVTINGNGWAAITGTSGNDAISITATSGNVTLTGLELDGAGVGNHGISLTSSLAANATLNIRDCVVSNFAGNGIAVQPTAAGSYPIVNLVVNLLIENTSSLNNGGDGVYIAPAGAAQVNGTISQTTAANNGHDGFEFSQPVGNYALDVIFLYDSIASQSSYAAMEVENCAAVYASQVRLFSQFSLVSVSGCSTSANSLLSIVHNSLITQVNMSGNAAVASDGTNMIYNVVGGTISKLTLQ